MKIQRRYFTHMPDGGWTGWRDQEHDEEFRIVPSDDEPLICYVAGPFSGKTRADVEANIRRAELLAIEVAKLGVLPLTPHCNTASPEFEHVQPYDFWIKGTMALLRRCDLIILTDDFERSSGARGERLEALNKLKMPLFYSIDELRVWLEKRELERSRDSCWCGQPTKIRLSDGAVSCSRAHLVKPATVNP